MGENVIKFNFFGLSFSRQIQIIDLYLNDIRVVDEYDDCKKIFKKYLVVVNKFSEFKDHFKSFSDDDRKKMRDLIEKNRKKINPNNEIKVNDSFNYFPSNKIDDSVVDKYIYDSFSYSKGKRAAIASDFFNYYSDIMNYDFNEILGLFNSNRDFFNGEIKKISGEFYSLYLLMNTEDRMKYIWYLSNYKVFTSSSVQDDNMKDSFSGDSKFIKPLHLGSKELVGNSKKLSKYFKLD